MHNKNCTATFINKFDFDIKGGKYDFTVLHYIVLYTDIQTTMFILQSVNINAFATDCYGRTARDLVKNTAVGKLLYKYEARAVRTVLSQVSRLTSSMHSETIKSAGDLTCAGARHNRPSSACTVYDMQNDQPDIFEEGITTPVHLKTKPYLGSLLTVDFSNPNYRFNTENTPKQYPNQLITSGDSSEAERKELKPTRVLIQHLNVPIIKNVPRKAHASVDTGRRLQKTDDGNVTDTESKCLDVSTRPTIHATKEGRSSDSLFQKCKCTIQKQLPLSRDEIALLNNSFKDYYKKMIDRGIDRFKKYKILYRMFKAYNSDTEAILVLLSERLNSTMIADIIYLLGFIKSRKATQTMTAIAKPTVLTNYEVVNALNTADKYPLTMIKGRNCRTQSSHSMMKSLSKPLIYTDATNLTKLVQFIPIKKALNYFDETNI